MLLAGCAAGVAAATNVASIEAEHLTADVTEFWVAPSAPGRICLTNTVVLGDLAGGSVLSSQCASFNPSRTNFQTSTGGHYYLCPGSPLLAAGTTNVSPRLLAEFAYKTTAPPVPFPADAAVTGEMTLYPQAPRYSGGSPDLGYWYQALDFTMAHLLVSEEAALTVQPGTAIGLRNDPVEGQWTSVCFDLLNGSSFMSQGTPAKRNILAPVHFVQEGPFGSTYTRAFIPDFWPNENNLPPPLLDLRFTDCYLPAEDFLIFAGFSRDLFAGTSDSSSMQWSLRDCALHGGGIMLGRPYPNDPDPFYDPGSVTWFNNLFDRVKITLDPTYYADDSEVNVDLQFQAYNNVFRDQTFALNPLPTSGSNWVLKDNLFDKIAFEPYWVGPLDHDYNAYWLRSPAELTSWFQTNSLPVNNDDGGTDAANDQLLATAPPYQAGLFGDCYLPTNTPLHHAGSRTPTDAGLYQYHNPA